MSKQNLASFFIWYWA